MAGRQPNSVGASTMAAMILEAQKKTGDAKTRYQTILQKDPNAAVAANNLAWIMLESGENLDMALQFAQTAKERLPTRPEVNDTLGWIYFKKGMLPQAISALKEATDRDPKNAGFHYHLGMAYAKVGDKAKAKASLETALRLQSTFPGADEARSTLASL